MIYPQPQLDQVTDRQGHPRRDQRDQLRAAVRAPRLQLQEPAAGRRGRAQGVRHRPEHPADRRPHRQAVQRPGPAARQPPLDEQPARVPGPLRRATARATSPGPRSCSRTPATPRASTASTPRAARGCRSNLHHRRQPAPRDPGAAVPGPGQAVRHGDQDQERRGRCSFSEWLPEGNFDIANFAWVGAPFSISASQAIFSTGGGRTTASSPTRRSTSCSPRPSRELDPGQGDRAGQPDRPAPVRTTWPRSRCTRSRAHRLAQHLHRHRRQPQPGRPVLERGPLGPEGRLGPGEAGNALDAGRWETAGPRRHIVTL